MPDPWLVKADTEFSAAVLFDVAKGAPAIF